MRIDAMNSLTEIDQPDTLSARDVSNLRVIQIEPEDAFEVVLMTLRLQAEPIVLLLPEQGQAFNDPSHFANVRAIRPAQDVSFMIPRSRIGVLGNYAHQYGFFFASSLEKASHFLHTYEEEQKERIQEVEQAANVQPARSTALVENGQEELDVQGSYGQQIVSPTQRAQPVPPRAEGLRPPPRRTKRISLIAIMVTFLGTASVLLVPALFSAQPTLIGPPVITMVGQVVFSSSGQLDPASTKGLNDTIIVSLYNLSSTLMARQSYYAWLMPDPTDDSIRPLLLGKLSVEGGKAQITYVHPDHENLLALYSGFEVAEQTNAQLPMTPPLDARMVRYVGYIPNTPTSGDEQHYSLLSHMRHLLAKDPTLQHIGLQGGLDIWLYRNAEKILEWSSAARDNWVGGKQTDLIHRHMIRVLDYLDGAAYAYSSGDVPPGSPLLVDPQAGRIGLLEVNPTQVLPAYLTHVDIHLQGLINAPGHTQAQKQLAIKLDTALKIDALLFQKVRLDAARLVKMDTMLLKSNDALSLLNDMVTNANTAYTGSFDPTSGGTINGIVWIHDELQGIASIAVTMSASENKE